MRDVQLFVPLEIIAARFHNTLVAAIVETVLKISKQHNINIVALSGGCFQNRYLLEHTVDALSRKQLKVMIHEKVPANDGGVSLGQLTIASFLIKGKK